MPKQSKKALLNRKKIKYNCTTWYTRPAKKVTINPRQISLKDSVGDNETNTSELNDSRTSLNESCISKLGRRYNDSNPYF